MLFYPKEPTLKVSDQYLHLLWSYKRSRSKWPTSERETRRERERRETRERELKLTLTLPGGAGAGVRQGWRNFWSPNKQKLSSGQFHSMLTIHDLFQLLGIWPLLGTLPQGNLPLETKFIWGRVLCATNVNVLIWVSGSGFCSVFGSGSVSCFWYIFWSALADP